MRGSGLERTTKGVHFTELVGLRPLSAAAAAVDKLSTRSNRRQSAPARNFRTVSQWLFTDDLVPLV